jgi:hypothetical protein
MGAFTFTHLFKPLGIRDKSTNVNVAPLVGVPASVCRGVDAICSSVYLFCSIDPPFPEGKSSVISQLGGGTGCGEWVTGFLTDTLFQRYYA